MPRFPDDFPITTKWPPRHPERLQLYSLPTPNGVKVSIMLEEIGLPYEAHRVSFDAGDQKSPEFRSLNPNGKIPAIIDADGPGGAPLPLFESGAILVYLARKYGGEKWLPLDAAPMAEVAQWLGVMQNETLYGLSRARLICKFKFPGHLEEAQALGRKGLDVLEQRLASHDWLALDRVTIPRSIMDRDDIPRSAELRYQRQRRDAGCSRDHQSPVAAAVLQRPAAVLDFERAA